MGDIDDEFAEIDRLLGEVHLEKEDIGSNAPTD